MIDHSSHTIIKYIFKVITLVIIILSYKCKGNPISNLLKSDEDVILDLDHGIALEKMGVIYHEKGMIFQPFTYSLPEQVDLGILAHSQCKMVGVSLYDYFQTQYQVSINVAKKQLWSLGLSHIAKDKMQILRKMNDLLQDPELSNSNESNIHNVLDKHQSGNLDRVRNKRELVLLSLIALVGALGLTATSLSAVNMGDMRSLTSSVNSLNDQQTNLAEKLNDTIVATNELTHRHNQLILNTIPDILSSIKDLNYKAQCDEVIMENMIWFSATILSQIPATNMRILNSIYQGKLTLDMLSSESFKLLIKNKFAGENSIFYSNPSLYYELSYYLVTGVNLNPYTIQGVIITPKISSAESSNYYKVYTVNPSVNPPIVFELEDYLAISNLHNVWAPSKQNCKVMLNNMVCPYHTVYSNYEHCLSSDDNKTLHEVCKTHTISVKPMIHQLSKGVLIGAGCSTYTLSYNDIDNSHHATNHKCPNHAIFINNIPRGYITVDNKTFTFNSDILLSPIYNATFSLPNITSMPPIRFDNTTVPPITPIYHHKIVVVSHMITTFFISILLLAILICGYLFYIKFIKAKNTNKIIANNYLKLLHALENTV